MFEDDWRHVGKKWIFGVSEGGGGGVQNFDQVDVRWKKVRKGGAVVGEHGEGVWEVFCAMVEKLDFWCI